MSEKLISKSKIQKIGEKGQRIYDKIKSSYEPEDNGKYLAIDVNTGKAYKGSTTDHAMKAATKAAPDQIFYLVKIGYTSLETMAQAILQGKGW